MSTSENKENHKRSKLYRFALYGRSNSGKTCILAALAMPHGSHPKHYTATVHPIDPSSAKDDVDKDKLEKNKAWINEATSFLRRGEILPPTPLDVNLQFQYEFTTPEHQNYWVELIDYSGELIDPELTGSELTKKLQEILKKMDGLLVLAEAPRQKNGQNESDNTFDELYKLQQAFTSLRSEMQDGVHLNLPIALLINKWDRLSNIECSNLDAEQTKLEDFFQRIPSPPHLGLADALSSVSEGSFKKFPVSALGECELINNEERPKETNPLHSFGLEDPFIWMAQRCDEMDFNRFTMQVEEHCQSLARFIKVTKSRSVIKTGNELSNRFLENPERTSIIKSWIKRCEKILWINAATVIGLVLFGVTGYDTWQFSNHQRTLENIAAKESTAASETELEQAERWFDNYIVSSHRYALSHFIHTATDAGNLLKKFRSLRESKSWLSVKEAKLDDELASAVEKYVKVYPYGEHLAEVQHLLTTSKLNKRLRANEEHLNFLKEKAASKLSMKLDDMRKLLEEFHKVPFPDEETPEQRQLRSKLSDELSKYLTDIVLKQDWDEFERSYTQLMSSWNIKEAATTLLGKSSSDVRLGALKDNFKVLAVSKIKEQVYRALEQGAFPEAKTVLEQYAEISPTLKSEESIKQIDQLSSEVARKHDRALYEQFKAYPDDGKITKYLDDAPLKSMRKPLEDYKAFLSKLNDKLALGVTLRFKWLDGKWGYPKNTIVMTINNDTILNEVINGEPITANSSKQLLVEKNQSLKIEVRITGKDWFSAEAKGSAPSSITAKDIFESNSNSLDFLLKKDGEKTVGTATIQVTGYPTPPKLPEWSE